MTAEYFLVGHPISASRSPRIQNAAFLAAGMDALYQLRPTAPADFARAMPAMLASDMAGANITAPFKEKILAHVAPADEFVELVGASNCVARAHGSWRAFNTDIDGFARVAESLLAAELVAAEETTVVVFGSGGVARAVLGACAKRGWAATIVARSATKAAELCAVAEALGVRHALPMALDRVSADPALRDLAQGRSTVLFANATPLGVQGEQLPPPFSCLDASVLVMDLVYVLTPLVTAHLARGGHAVDGLHMVVEQAAVAWSIWTGEAAPREVMRRAVGIPPLQGAGSFSRAADRLSIAGRGRLTT